MSDVERRNEAWRAAILDLTNRLEEASINYTLKGAAALVVFGQDALPNESLICAFQWDQVNEAYHLFFEHGAGPLNQTNDGASFQATLKGIPVQFFCTWNQVIVTDPTRLAREFEGKTVYAEAPTAILRAYGTENAIGQAAKDYLQEIQRKNTELSRSAWNTGTYEAWVNRFGEPKQLGKELRSQPNRKLAPLLDYIGEVQGKNVLNLMGSNGIKAVAMASKGAAVTVVDLSEESAHYADQLAKAADVPLTYIVGDVLNPNEVDLPLSKADLILMERGILHYFVDLAPLMHRIFQWLKPGGRFVLQDFHPISTKLIHSKGKKHQVNGNYFNQEIEQTPVATSKYAEKTKTAYVYHHRWTLSEVVTAVAATGLRITQLDERPNEKRQDIGIPKMFTLVAEKIEKPS